MALRKFVERWTQPVEEQDRQQLTAWCELVHSTPIDEVDARHPARIAGEVRSVRIVPRAGADALEVTVNDGRASVISVFFGRRKIGGISPGRRVLLEGVVVPDGNQRFLYNPVYTLL